MRAKYSYLLVEDTIGIMLSTSRFIELDLYHPLNRFSRKVIHFYGTPKFAMTHHPITIFLGSNVNGSTAKNLLKELCKDTPPWLVTYFPKTIKTQPP